MPLSFDARDYNVISVNGEELHVRSIAEQVYVLRSRCPHRGGPLRLGRIRDEVIVCPWHGTKVALSRCVAGAAPTVFRRSSNAVFVAIDACEDAMLRWSVTV